MYWLFYVFIAVGSVNGFALPFEGLFKLDIVHYNDFHARFEETSVETPTCKFNNNSCLGGFPRLYYKIKSIMKEKPDALLLNAGDSFQGTYWYTLLKWNVTQMFMNLLPHDAHAIGNHEFDDGPEGLAPYLKSLKAPVLAANMDASEEPSLQGLYKPHVIVKRNGRRIGIIGLITPDTKTLSSPGNVRFTDPGEATRREANALTCHGVDIIVLISHCGLEVDKFVPKLRDQPPVCLLLTLNRNATLAHDLTRLQWNFMELARDYGENIDIIVGGHSHSLLWNGTAPSMEEVAGPYPVTVEVAKHRKNHKVLIVQASAFTKYMGSLSLYFDYLGEVVNWNGGPIFLNRSIPEDNEIKTKLAPFAELVHKAENMYVGQTLKTMFSDDCVYGECTLGDLLVDSFNAFAKSVYNSPYTYLSFVQRGDIKSSIYEGNITRGELFELLPYNDRMLTFALQGTYVAQALERSVMDAWAYRPFKGPYVLQVSGLQVTYNISKPEGQRVIAVDVIKESERYSLNPQQYYQVTVPSFLADGGDGFTMFKTNKINATTIGRDFDVLETYITNNSPLNLTTGGRITIYS